MVQTQLITRQAFMKQMTGLAGALALVANCGISAESTDARTAGSGNEVSRVTRDTGLAEPRFGNYRVSTQHQIKTGNAFYPSIANLDGTLYVIQGSGDTLFIQTFDLETLTPGEATEVWNTRKPESIHVIERLVGAQDMDMTIWNDQLWITLVQGDPKSKDPEDLFGFIELRPLEGDRLGRGIRWDSRDHGLGPQRFSRWTLGC